MGNYGGVRKGSIWYAKDYTDIKYDPTNYKPTDAEVPINTSAKDIPYIKGFVEVGNYNSSSSGWVMKADYDISLYCATECDRYASATSHECSDVRREVSARNGYRRVSASVVGCDIISGALGRTLHAESAVADGVDSYAGGFALGNPSL